LPTVIDIRTLNSQPFIFLPVYIDGTGPYNFVLDTGAGISLITKDLAGNLQIKDARIKEALGAGSRRINVLVGQVGSISVGSSMVENINIGIMDALPQCIGQGIIGYDFLKHYVLTIDYPHDKLTLTAPEEEKNDGKLLQASLRFRFARPDRPVILVDVLVNARSTFQFVLDTGASQTIISPVIARQMGIKSTDVDAIVGAGGSFAAFAGTLDSLRVGDALLEKVEVVVSDIFSPLSLAAGTGMDGILGHNVLRNFTVIIDYPNERILLQKERLPLRYRPETMLNNKPIHLYNVPH